MTMKYSFLYSLLIVAASFQLSLGAISNTVNTANEEQQRRPNQLRGSSITSEEDGERSLDGSQWRNGYRSGNNNGYYANGQYRNYRNRGYYARYYQRNNYYPRKYYYGAAGEGYYSEENEDADDDINSGSTNAVEEVEERFWEWYQSPPADWTPAQWAWFSGLLSFGVGFLFCCCLGCASLCVETQEKICCCGRRTDYDDSYRSIDREKSQSFMTLNSQASHLSTTGGSTNVSLNTPRSDDDDATYDSIMRMRSAESR